MIQRRAIPTQQTPQTNRTVAIGLWAVFITQFVSFLLINARNIANPVMIAEFDGMALFPWLIALPALSGAIGTLLSGKLDQRGHLARNLRLAIEIPLQSCDRLIGFGHYSTSIKRKRRDLADSRMKSAKIYSVNSSGIQKPTVSSSKSDCYRRFLARCPRWSYIKERNALRKKIPQKKWSLVQMER